MIGRRLKLRGVLPEREAHLLDGDGGAAVCPGRPLFAVRVTPFHQLPLVFATVLGPEFIQQRHLGVGQVFARRHLFELHQVVGAAADALLPALIALAGQSPRVDEVEHLAPSSACGAARPAPDPRASQAKPARGPAREPCRGERAWRTCLGKP